VTGEPVQSVCDHTYDELDRLVGLQCGSHERSNTNVRFACELVRNGRLGEVKTVHINLPCSDGHHKKAQELSKQDPPEIPTLPVMTASVMAARWYCSP